MNGKTVADRLEAAGGRPTGFDYLRIELALSIVVWHTVQVSYGHAAASVGRTIGLRPVVGLILPMFFALSGFLVAGSLERSRDITRFLGLRALRIYPALVAETLLSAFILGPMLTTLPLAVYFSGQEFHNYLLNCFGIIHFYLPGLFASNPDPRTVNNQLWTVPFELQCYVLLSLLMFFGVIYRRKLFVIVLIALQVGLVIHSIIASRGHLSVFPGPVQGANLVMTFLGGVAMFGFRRQIIVNKWLFAAALIATFVALDVPLGDHLLALPVGYITIYLGVKNPRANLLHKLGDMSYGIYLYAFPLQQVVASWGSWAHHWYVSLAFALPLAIFVAYVSWNFIEKPALSLRKYLGVLKPLDFWLDALKRTSRSGLARLLPAYQTGQASE